MPPEDGHEVLLTAGKHLDETEEATGCREGAWNLTLSTGHSVESKAREHCNSRVASTLLPLCPGRDDELSWSSFGPRRQVSCWAFSCLPRWAGGRGAGTSLHLWGLEVESYAGFDFQWAR